MANLGLPYLSIRFIEQGIERIGRSKRNVAALLLQDKKLKGRYTIYTASDIPEEMEEANKEQIMLCLKGYVHTPRYVEVIAEQYTETKKFDVSSDGFKQLETIRFDYLAVPFASDEEQKKIATWIKTLNDNADKRCKFVGCNTNEDHQKIINYTTKWVKTSEKEYKGNEYVGRICGLLAGTPQQISPTYAPLPELIDCEYFKKNEIEEKIGNGEFILINDGRKIKVARGVNSLTTTNQIKGGKYKKIKIVDIMDAMADDIQMAAEDSYIGKYDNSYDNKCLLMSAIEGYMEVLEKDSLLAKGQSKVEIDLESQRAYLKSVGYKTVDGRDVNDMEENEIKEADTGDKVFLIAHCKILDAIEEIELPVII